MGKQIRGTNKAFIFFLVLLFSFTGCGLLENWKVFESKEGKFSVLMPGKVENLSQLMRLPVGWVDVKLFSSSGKDKISYMASYTDYSEKIFTPEITIDQLLDSARDGAVANVKGMLIKETKITLGSLTGRELRIDFDKGKATIRSRLFIAGHRLYQVMAFVPKGQSGAEKVDRFLDSFKLK